MFLRFLRFRLQNIFNKILEPREGLNVHLDCSTGRTCTRQSGNHLKIKKIQKLKFDHELIGISCKFGTPRHQMSIKFDFS